MQRTLKLTALICLVATLHGLRINPPANTSAVVNFHARRANISGPACQCKPDDPSWKKPVRTQAACLFFDLGAADGETFKVFNDVSAKWRFYYETAGFTDHRECYSYLIEANPRFASDLERLRSERVYPMPQVAAYMCDKPKETFYVDVGNDKGWGSALNATHESVAKKHDEVTVRLENLMRLLTENAIPADTVVIKMDIEGAEWDILPCLAKSPALHLIDTLYLENHCNGQGKNKWCPTTGQAGTSWEQWNSTLAIIQRAGVQIPGGYWSPM